MTDAVVALRREVTRRRDELARLEAALVVLEGRPASVEEKPRVANPKGKERVTHGDVERFVASLDKGVQRSLVARHFGLTPPQAGAALSALVSCGTLRREGRCGAAKYFAIESDAARAAQ